MAKKKVPPFLSTFHLANGEDIEPWEVLRRFAEKLKDQIHCTGPDADTWLRDLVWAAQVLLAPGKLMAYLEVGHEVYVAQHAEDVPQVAWLRQQPWYTLVLAEMLPSCEMRREDRGNAFDSMGGMLEEVLELFPEHIRASSLEGAIFDDPADLLKQLLEARTPNDGFHYAELHRRQLTLSRIEFGFWRLAPTAKGSLKLGQASVISKKDRQLSTLADPPLFRIMLALDYWLCASSQERLRLVHHELMHCQVKYNDDGEPTPSILGHDVEEFLMTAHHFGSLSASQDALGPLLVKHPSPKSIGHSQLSLNLQHS